MKEAKKPKVSKLRIALIVLGAIITAGMSIIIPLGVFSFNWFRKAPSTPISPPPKKIGFFRTFWNWYTRTSVPTPTEPVLDPVVEPNEPTTPFDDLTKKKDAIPPSPPPPVVTPQPPPLPPKSKPKSNKIRFALLMGCKTSNNCYIDSALQSILLIPRLETKIAHAKHINEIKSLIKDIFEKIFKNEACEGQIDNMKTLCKQYNVNLDGNDFIWKNDIGEGLVKNRSFDEFVSYVQKDKNILKLNQNKDDPLFGLTRSLKFSETLIPLLEAMLKETQPRPKDSREPAILEKPHQDVLNMYQMEIKGTTGQEDSEEPLNYMIKSLYIKTGISFETEVTFHETKNVKREISPGAIPIPVEHAKEIFKVFSDVKNEVYEGSRNDGPLGPTVFIKDDKANLKERFILDKGVTEAPEFIYLQTQQQFNPDGRVTYIEYNIPMDIHIPFFVFNDPEKPGTHEKIENDYVLCAICMKHGERASSGHYTINVLDGEHGTDWYNVNDLRAVVSQKSSKEIEAALKSCSEEIPRVLMYMRKDLFDERYGMRPNLSPKLT